AVRPVAVRPVAAPLLPVAARSRPAVTPPAGRSRAAADQRAPVPAACRPASPHQTSPRKPPQIPHFPALRNSMNVALYWFYRAECHFHVLPPCLPSPCLPSPCLPSPRLPSP